MTREQALKKAQKLWGKHARIEIGQRLSSPEDRAKNTADRADINARIDALKETYNTWLQAQPEHQLFRATLKQLFAQRDRVPSHYYKFRVGHTGMGGMFYHVEGQGDTWEEAFANADPEKRKQQALASVAK